MKTIIFIIGLSIFLCLSACDEDEPTQPSNQFELKDFPLKIGNWWKYQVIDSLNNTQDTLLIKVSGDGYNNGFHNNVLKVFLKDSLIGSSKIVSSENTITFFKNDTSKIWNYFSFKDFFFKLPLSVGNKWDTYIVESYNENVDILNHKYNGFKIVNTMDNMPGADVNIYYISPNIGIVSISEYSGGFGPRIKMFLKLIDYKIN